MEIELSALITKCPKCGNTIIIKQVRYPGGCNDSGVFELECKKCKEHFEVSGIKDVDASSVESGAKLLNKRYK